MPGMADMAAPIDCEKTSPFRPLAWRWERARILRAGAAVPPEGDVDRWVHQAVQYQEAWERAEAGAGGGQGRLAAAMPAVFRAHEFWRRRDHPLTWGLEARLLTDESYAEIAARLALTAEAVEAYEALFFQVKDRLHLVDYIHAM